MECGVCAAVEYLPDIVACDIRFVFAVSFSTGTSSTESDTPRRLYILLYREPVLHPVDSDDDGVKTPEKHGEHWSCVRDSSQRRVQVAISGHHRPVCR